MSLGPAWGGVGIAGSAFERLKKRVSTGAAVDAEAPNSPDAHWLLLLATNHVALMTLGCIRRLALALPREFMLDTGSCHSTAAT